MNPTHIKTVQVELIIHSYQGQEPMNIYLKLSVFIIRIKQSKFKILRFWDFFFFFLFSIDTITWVKQKVWSFDSISTVFLLSFLGFGFTFHRFLGNQTEIENSRERERDLLGGDIGGARLEEEVEVRRVGLENHAIVSVHCLHRLYFCRNFLFFDDAACHCSQRERERCFFSFMFWERENNRDAFSSFYPHWFGLVILKRWTLYLVRIFFFFFG